jgi:hypothetical protein
VRVPPPPRARRARRKETIDDLIEGWTTSGPDYFEKGYLRARGLGRWIERGRVTAEMIVELLLLTLEEYEDAAADPVGDRASERYRMIEILHRRQRTRGLTGAEASLLHDMTELERRASQRPPPALEAYTDERLRVYEAEDEETRSEWQVIRERHAPTLADVSRELTESLYSTKRLHLGKGFPVIELGEQARLRAHAQKLRRELGERFLDPASTMEYRAARVRKWNQLRRASADS